MVLRGNHDPSRPFYRPVMLVLLVAPVTAEYLIGYDDTTGNVAALLAGIAVFAPLYGAPAVLIREITRRLGLGWPTVLALAAAFGLIQAGLIDQSLFDPAYRDIPYWDDLREPTYLPWFGTSAFMVLTFVAGHLFGSIAAPIALAESWWPARADRPWLGRVGLTVMGGLWAGAAALVLQDQFASTSFRISPLHLGLTVAVVLGLVVLAVTRAPDARVRRPGLPPKPWAVAVISGVLLWVRSLVPAPGSRRLSRRPPWSDGPPWSRRGRGARAGTGVIWSLRWPVTCWPSVARRSPSPPLGDVPLPVKLASNVLLLVMVLALAAWGYRVQRRWNAQEGNADPAMG
jgi:hypothetical protein